MDRVTDMFGNELKVGDNVCFIGNPNADWRQNKMLIRKKIINIINTKKQSWLILIDNEPKVSPNRVVKCY